MTILSRMLLSAAMLMPLTAPARAQQVATDRDGVIEMRDQRPAGAREDRPDRPWSRAGRDPGGARAGADRDGGRPMTTGNQEPSRFGGRDRPGRDADRAPFGGDNGARPPRASFDQRPQRDDRAWDNGGDRSWTVDRPGRGAPPATNGWRRDGGQERAWQGGDRGFGQGDRGSNDGNRAFANGDRGGAWSRDWRRDRRYDWSRTREGDRARYRLPRYYAPHGWGYGYRRYSVGIVLSRPLWDRGYWIDDPYAYRLPEAYGPFRWVRYYDDALLVDVRTGGVIDAVYGIFW